MSGKLGLCCAWHNGSRELGHSGSGRNLEGVSLGCSGLEGVFTGSSGLLDSPLPKEEGGETVDDRFSRLGFRQDVVSRRRREAEPKIGEAISSEQCVQIPTVEFLAFEG